MSEYLDIYSFSVDSRKELAELKMQEKFIQMDRKSNK